MSDKKANVPQSGMSVGDIYYVLFRRKWMILALSVAGIVAALAVCVIKPPQYKSEAELSLDVLATPALSAPGEEGRPMGGAIGNIVNNEMEILQSLDLAQHVVQAMTPERILAGAGGGRDTNQAAYLIQKGLTVENVLGSSVIHLTFQHPDTNIVQEALNYIIDGYFTKHFQMHHGVIVVGDFLTNEIVRLHGELAQTQKQIQQAQSEAGVIDLEVAKQDYADRIAKFRADISSAETDLAEHQATVKALSQGATTNTNGEAVAKISADQYDEYRRVCARLAILTKKEDDYLTQQGFTQESILVKDVRRRLPRQK